MNSIQMSDDTNNNSDQNNPRILWSGPFLDGVLTIGMSPDLGDEVYIFNIVSYDLAFQGNVMVSKKLHPTPTEIVKVVMNSVEKMYKAGIMNDAKNEVKH